MSHFDDAVFPDLSGKGTGFIIERPTQQVAVNSGDVFTNALSEKSRRRYGVRLEALSSEEAQSVLDYYEALEGPNNSFLYKDWSDHITPQGQRPEDVASITALDQPLKNTVTGGFTGDGSTTTFQCGKNRTAGSASTFREVKKLQDGTTLDPALSGTILVARASTPTTAFSVVTSTGVVTFSSAPANGVSVTWGGAYYTPVKFDADSTEISMQAPDQARGLIVLEEVFNI